MNIVRFFFSSFENLLLDLWDQINRSMTIQNYCMTHPGIEQHLLYGNILTIALQVSL